MLISELYKEFAFSFSFKEVIGKILLDLCIRGYKDYCLGFSPD